MKVIVSETMGESGIAILQSSADVEILPELWQDKKELLRKTRDADALIVRNQTVVDDELLSAAKQLKVVGRLGVGLDNIALATADKLAIQVISAKNANAISVAEYVMAVLLSTSRSLQAANTDVKRGNWNRSRFMGNELYGKTLGLVGVGEISHRVAKRAIAFGMRVIGYDPNRNSLDYPFSETNLIKAELNDVLRKSDFISLHVPLTKHTRSLIAVEELRQMKRTAVLINSSRGGVVNETALLAALDGGWLAAAYLDVLAIEPVRKDNPLLKNTKVHLTPHIAGLTKESQKRISEIIANEVIRVLQGKRSLNLVHIPS
ncbi:MAG: hydroxyacid dehydrogenase [Sporolactobacillus sp.]|jgi:D-3-phosphoglycerate dehydrogenase/(S)-sulfolactate dehydrogenase|nr:hydroxyacid dehydrogenase [Sporolactobacillus sp.]